MEALANIGFDWQIALSELVTFVLILWVLSRFVFKPIGAIIEKRNKEIQTGLDRAKESQSILAQAEQTVEQEIKDAKKQANQILADAKETADDQIAKAQDTAQEEAKDILEKAHGQIKKDKATMEKELFDKTAGLVALGVQKILEEDVTEPKSSEISKRALDILETK